MHKYSWNEPGGKAFSIKLVDRSMTLSSLLIEVRGRLEQPVPSGMGSAMVS